jgi:hypothetical protein
VGKTSRVGKMFYFLSTTNVPAVRRVSLPFVMK